MRYFLPPNWVMDKEVVSTLTIQELSMFPLDDFFDHYEKGLRKVNILTYLLTVTQKTNSIMLYNITYVVYIFYLSIRFNFNLER